MSSHFVQVFTSTLAPQTPSEIEAEKAEHNKMIASMRKDAMRKRNVKQVGCYVLYRKLIKKPGEWERTTHGRSFQRMTAIGYEYWIMEIKQQVVVKQILLQEEDWMAVRQFNDSRIMWKQKAGEARFMVMATGVSRAQALENFDKQVNRIEDGALRQMEWMVRCGENPFRLHKHRFPRKKEKRANSPGV